MGNKRNYGRKKKILPPNKKKCVEVQWKSDEIPSTSVGLNNDSDSKMSDNYYGYILFDFTCLLGLVSCLACPECKNVGSVSVSLEEKKRCGLSECMQLLCANCGYNSDEHFSSKKCHLYQKKYHEINRRFVYSTRAIGCNYAEASRLCYLLGLSNPINPSAYQSHIKSIESVVTQLADEVMKEAATEVKRESGTAECAVSVDGTWQRRGFSSLFGVVSAISVKTGKVLDVEVLSKDCMSCRKHANEDKNSLPYQVWLTKHKNKCLANYQGSSPSMEPVGAGRIFMRSVQTRGLEYTQYLGDGDSKSYKTVTDLDPYNGKSIAKLECVGHYQKRLGHSLREVAKSKRLGGRGKLTHNIIDKLQNYFGIALRSNTTSVEDMSRAIWASLFHVASNDNQPLHAKCPDGADSWCSYKVAKAEGIQYKHKHSGLDISIIRQIKPVYERLTDSKMLEKCLHGKTQNANEAFNGTIWNRCPKESYTGYRTVKLCVSDAVCHFNKGPMVESEILRRMGINPGVNTSVRVLASEEKKKKMAERQRREEVKCRRRLLRGKKKKKIDKQEATEGVTYAAGGF